MLFRSGCGGSSIGMRVGDGERDDSGDTAAIKMAAVALACRVLVVRRAIGGGAARAGLDGLDGSSMVMVVVVVVDAVVVSSVGWIGGSWASWGASAGTSKAADKAAVRFGDGLVGTRTFLMVGVGRRSCIAIERCGSVSLLATSSCWCWCCGRSSSDDIGSTRGC